MESIIFYGLLALIGMALLGALLPARPTQPQIIYVLAEPQAQGGAGGGLLALAIFIALVVALRLAVG